LGARQGTDIIMLRFTLRQNCFSLCESVHITGISMSYSMGSEGIRD